MAENRGRYPLPQVRHVARPRARGTTGRRPHMLAVVVIARQHPQAYGLLPLLALDPDLGQGCRWGRDRQAPHWASWRFADNASVVRARARPLPRQRRGKLGVQRGAQRPLARPQYSTLRGLA